MGRRILVTTIFVFFGGVIICIGKRLVRIDYDEVGSIYPEIRSVNTK